MLFKNVMVPYDGSDHAIRALDTAAKLIADDPNAKIHVVNVIATSDFTPKYGNSNPFWHPYDSMDEASYARLMVEAKESAIADLKADLHDTLAELGDKASVDVITSAGTGAGADLHCPSGLPGQPVGKGEKNGSDLTDVMGRCFSSLCPRK